MAPLAMFACVSWAGSKLSPDLALVDPALEVDVIVQYNVSPSEARHARAAQRGARLRKRLDEGKAAVYTVRGQDLAGIESDADVDYISPDRPVRAFLDYAYPTTNASIARSSYGWTGKGIGVAVIDSGMYAHPDLNGNDLITNIVYSGVWLAMERKVALSCPVF